MTEAQKWREAVKELISLYGFTIGVGLTQVLTKHGLTLDEKKECQHEWGKIPPNDSIKYLDRRDYFLYCIHCGEPKP